MARASSAVCPGPGDSVFLTGQRGAGRRRRFLSRLPSGAVPLVQSTDGAGAWRCVQPTPPGSPQASRERDLPDSEPRLRSSTLRQLFNRRPARLTSKPRRGGRPPAGTRVKSPACPCPEACVPRGPRAYRTIVSRLRPPGGCMTGAYEPALGVVRRRGTGGKRGIAAAETRPSA